MHILQKIKKKFKKRKNSELNYDIHERLITAIFLSIVGGMLDAHTFLFRGKIFANTQTGNIVFLALSVSNQNFSKTLNYIFSLIAFIIGIFLTEILKHFFKNKILMFVNIVILIEILFLALLAFFPENFLNNVVISIISFVCSMQTNGFRTVHGSLYASTMCTGNLRSASANFLNFVLLKNKQQGLVCLRYVIILFAFFVGVVLGCFLTRIFCQFTLLFCASVLFFNLIVINLKHVSCS